MLFNIPQFIDKEDKIVGPLTAKQLGWCALGGVAMFLAWSQLDFSGFIIASIPIVFLTISLAFYRPNGMSLVFFIGASTSFFSKPKVYLWKQLPGKSKEKEVEITPVSQNHPTIERKRLDSEKVNKIISILNSK